MRKLLAGLIRRVSTKKTPAPFPTKTYMSRQAIPTAMVDDDLAMEAHWQHQLYETRQAAIAAGHRLTGGCRTRLLTPEQQIPMTWFNPETGAPEPMPRPYITQVEVFLRDE